ncbi:hypothetical protein BDV30DRAFT_72635 [Aspergillus minisclerotigenes]|uniref:Uncharacterized protein n=1 Tax=Aspergillus minisclerotigenes TaxID=656917 RepID=A0A5N6JLK5_9EURO|nr:hypothetical protein BDV30DRAFT_72635 [Aspergillus minisclerotigenes]
MFRGCCGMDIARAVIIDLSDLFRLFALLLGISFLTLSECPALNILRLNIA